MITYRHHAQRTQSKFWLAALCVTAALAGCGSTTRVVSTSSSVALSSVATPIPLPGSAGKGVVSDKSAGCVPDHVTVPAVGISQHVAALGLNAAGQIYPPRATTMWYSGSARVGSDGITVIAAHVSYDGPDNFFRLPDVGVGDTVSLACRGGGHAMKWRVVRTASVLKTALRTDQSVWGVSRTPVVVLVTCDPDTAVVKGHHLGNFAVWAVPVRDAGAGASHAVPVEPVEPGSTSVPPWLIAAGTP